MSAPTRPAGGLTPVRGLAAVVGFLVLVEVASGVLQGFYVPIFPQIAEHLAITEGDVNWFEAAQLVVSALCVPLLARLADLYGHRRILLASTAVTAVASWALAVAPGFWTFLVAWALQGAYVIWLPLEVAIIHRRTRGRPDQERLTRRGAAVLVGALELAVIVGALSSGLLVERFDVGLVLALPGVVVTLAYVAIRFGVEDAPGDAHGGLDWTGLGLVSLSLGLVMAGLVVVRVAGAGSLVAWGAVLAGLGVLVPFVRHQLRLEEPLVDVRLLASARQWPVQVTAFLFGVPVLGGQIPLSTFVQADPAERGYGLGAEPAFVSTLIGLYVITLAVGAFSLPLLTRLVGVRPALVTACLLVALGYALWLPFHDQVWQAVLNMAVAGLGSGVLVAALPAVAAAAAPPERTGFATGMTNATKAVGAAVASAVFAIALAADGTAEAPVAPLSGYLTVWAVCSAASVLAALALLASPRHAWSAPTEEPVASA